MFSQSQLRVAVADVITQTKYFCQSVQEFGSYDTLKSAYLHRVGWSVLHREWYLLVCACSEAEYSNEHVCLSVCMHAPKLHRILCAWCILPSFGPPLAAEQYVMYFRFCVQSRFFNNGPSDGVTPQQQRRWVLAARQWLHNVLYESYTTVDAKARYSCKCCRDVDWLHELRLTSHSTLNRRRSYQPISWLVLRKSQSKQGEKMQTTR